MDPALLATAAQRVRTDLPRLSALLVVRGGDIVAESYFNGQTSAAPIDVWSVTKSVTSMAVGIAIAEGRLRLDQTLGDLIPERIPAGADPRTARVTVEQLLTMTGGWAWDSRTDFMHLDDTPDWAARTLGLPMACDPGTCYEYNSGGVHLLSVILQKVTGQTEADYVQTRIFDPLGIARPAWRQSPQGETAGAFGLMLTARDAAKLGFLYLNDGNWDGRQLVPAAWVATSTTLHSSGTSPSGINLGLAGYGYLWWVTNVAGFPAFFALGYGSQVIYVVPGLDLVVVALVAQPLADQQQDPMPVIDDLIVAAARAGPIPAAAAIPQAQATPTSASAVAATPIGASWRLFALPAALAFPAGVAYQATTGDFYVGSATDGTIARGNVERGAAAVFLPGSPGRVALGLAVDDRGRLFVAGGQTGAVAVYDTATGARLAELSDGLAPNTYLNGVAVAPNGDVYVTDSFNPILWRWPAAAIPNGNATPAATPIASGALERFLDLSSPPFAFGPGYNAAGIVATPDGRFLLVVQSNTGYLYRVDIVSRTTTRIDLGNEALIGGGGLALDGHRLFAVAGGAIAVVELDGDFATGRVIDRFTDPTFSSPTSIARHDGCLLVVNSQFASLQGQPSLPFTVSSVAIPAPDAATPAPTRC
jgi:Cu-Zn family superoxide dismutase